MGEFREDENTARENSTVLSSGVEAFASTFQKTTQQQRDLLAQYREGTVGDSRYVREALAVERRQRIGENLPAVARFYQKVEATRLADQKAKLESDNSRDFMRDYDLHRIKVTTDIITLLQFKSWKKSASSGEDAKDVVSDESAQNAAMMGIFALMLETTRAPGYESGAMVREEQQIRDSGDPESQEVKDKLNDLQVLKGRFYTLFRDLWDQYHYLPLNNLKSMVRRLNFTMLDYRAEERFTVRDCIASNVDRDYYQAWFIESGDYRPQRERNPQLKQRIENKWDSALNAAQLV